MSAISPPRLRLALAIQPQAYHGRLQTTFATKYEKREASAKEATPFTGSRTFRLMAEG